MFMHTECDQTFVSRPGGPQNGTFTAPAINNPSNHSRQCLYIFLAGPGQRVEITFTSFNLRGSPPEYVKYSQKRSHLCLLTFFNLNIIFIHATVERPLVKFHRKYKMNEHDNFHAAL